MAKKIHNALENFQLFKSFSKILAPETKNSILDLNVCFFESINSSIGSKVIIMAALLKNQEKKRETPKKKNSKRSRRRNVKDTRREQQQTSESAKIT
jgi:hypothetical protein